MGMTARDRTLAFDDRNIVWLPLGDVKGFVVSILSVDRPNRTVDFLIKFDPNTKLIYHRHLALTHTFVIEGDHVIYETDGTIRDSRPVGRYSVATVAGDVHSEGGGPDGCTLHYSVRGDTDDMFEIFDDTFGSVAIMKISDFEDILNAQQTAR